MSDLKDIMGVPSRPTAALPFEADAPAKSKAPKMKRPEGLSREAFALHDGSHPIAPTHLPEGLKKSSDIQGLKQKRLQTSKGRVTWQWQSFINEARTDGLQLEHWAKYFKDSAGNMKPEYEGPYRWAKLDVKPMVYRYDDEEWDNIIAKDPDWSRDETDYLLDLCDTFKLRFVPIADRYEWPQGKARRVEDLKARYYTLARQLLVAREGGDTAVANHVLVKQPYNAQQERQRREAVGQLLKRQGHEEAEEQEVLQQASVIEARRRQEAASQRTTTAGPAPPGQAVPMDVDRPSTISAASEGASLATMAEVPAGGFPSLLGPQGQPLAPPRPGVYSRSRHAAEQGSLHVTRLPGGARVHKAVEAALADFGVPERPPSGTRAVCAAWLALRAEVCERLELARTTQGRSSDGPGRKSKSKGARVR